MGLLSIVGRLGSGYLFDRMDARLVAAAGVALPAATGLLLFALPGSVPAAAVAILLIGLAQGAELGATSYLIGRHFGLRSFGMLFGVSVSAMTLATGLGPLLASYIYDATGSYRLMMLLALPASLAASAMLVAVGRAPPLTEGGAPAADGTAPAA